jgi:signal transduction histidine kinase
MLLVGPAIMMLALAILLVREMERSGGRIGFGAMGSRQLAEDDRTKIVMNAAPIGIALWGPRGRLIEANDRFRSHIGTNPRDIVLEDLDRRAGFVPAGLADEMAVTGFANLSESGTSLMRRGPNLLLKNTRTLPQGETLIATIDVTGLRMRSEAFARAEQDLSTERARAESAELEKTSLFTSASHELRTPLNAILGFSEIMKDGVLGPLGNAKYAEYARDIHESGHRLLGLVDGILTMSDVEKGQSNLQLGPVDPTAIARDCLIDLGEFAKDRGVNLVGRLILVPNVYADAAALRQVFIHLITNALRRAAPGGRVEMGCESGAEDVRFTLKNLGALSTEIDHKRMTLSGVAKSNDGLGLVIARSLVQLQGGELSVSNEADGSVSVAFTLPRQSAVARRERAA